MKTLYIECNMGAAGDMLLSALSELHWDPEDFFERLNRAGIPNVTFEKEALINFGIKGTHVKVKVYGEEENENMHSHHHHNHLHNIEHIINSLNISDKVKNDVMSVYKIIAEAEAYVHNSTIENIHFHEVGTLDAIADITGVCMLIDELAPEKIICSPINTGSGFVKCAHGTLPVPAPATAYILKNIPAFSDGTMTELTTPTGAALLKYFSNEYGNMPLMKTDKIGYGFGTKQLEKANCIRAFMGEAKESENEISELICNVDDMTGEEIGFAVKQLFENGALDVFTTPVYMKKNRPGIMLTCICTEDKKDLMLKLIFMHTSTIGIRENISKRYVLNREEKTIETKYGSIRIKESTGYGISKSKAEYNDIENIALKNNISITEVKNSIKK